MQALEALLSGLEEVERDPSQKLKGWMRLVLRKHNGGQRPVFFVLGDNHGFGVASLVILTVVVSAEALPPTMLSVSFNERGEFVAYAEEGVCRQLDISQKGRLEAAFRKLQPNCEIVYT